MRRSIVCAAALACLCGCNTVKDGFVAQQWSKNISELGVHPLFPPREDLYVGDVFLNFDGDILPADGLHIASLNVLTALQSQYAQRPDLPASAGASGKFIFGTQAGQARVKAVALPYFVRVTATGAEVGAFVPVDAMTVKAGISVSSVKSASVTISSASSISLPWNAIDEKLHEDTGFCIADPTGTCSAANTLGMLRRVGGYTKALCTSKGQAYVDVFVVSEVYYGQTFDVTLHVASDIGASLGVSAATAAANSASAVSAAASSAGSAASAAETAASAATSAASAASAAADNVSDKTAAANQAAAAATTSAKQATAAASLAASAAAAATNASDLATSQTDAMRADIARAQQLAPASPGVAITFGQSSSGDVGLRQTYDHPIAIGYRGVTFKVDLCTDDAKTPVVSIPGPGRAEFLIGPSISKNAPLRTKATASPSGASASSQ
jgi:hypothetical protein